MAGKHSNHSDVEAGKDLTIRADPEQPKACCGGALDKTSQAMPRHLWLVLLFVVLIGIFMSFVIPTFLYYRKAGDAALSGTWQAWVGCSDNITSASPPAANTTQPAVFLSRYKGIDAGNLDPDLAEATFNITSMIELSPRLVPVCPATNGNSGPNPGAPLNPDQPFVKVTFTLSTIAPDQASATMDVTMEAMNSLDYTPPNEKPSLLNVTGGSITVTASPALAKPLEMEWNEKVKVFPAITVQLTTQSPITNYPWDVYAIERALKGEMVLLNGTTMPETRPLPIQVWTQTTTQQWSAWVINEQNQTSKDLGQVLYLSTNQDLVMKIERSFFTKSYAVVLVIFLWLIGGLNLMHCLDNVFVRPRDLKDAFAPALLFALPSFRNTMPGIPPVVGVAVDMIGLIWAELMIAICVLVSFIAFLGQYKHDAPLFRRKVKAA